MDEIGVGELLRCLLECCEKAARIARLFRGEDELFGLLVEEKSEIRKNRRVVQDFKTLADVLVQETIKRDVGTKFPILSSKIQGEEQNSFQNTLGESIKVELTDSREETVDLLCKVLDGKVQIAESLADTVHSAVAGREDELHSSHFSVPAENIGIWIDPIDSTAEYIQAKQNNMDQYGIELNGLKCVCVLIGVYDLTTGIPIMGIINQPFYRESGTASKWESNIYWGVSYHSERKLSTSVESQNEPPGERKRKVIVTSSFEDQQLQSIMRSRYAVVHAAGAGYKCLIVASKMADLYVLSLQNTHYWDTCGPQAILSAQGGGMVHFGRAVGADQEVDRSNVGEYQLRYLEEHTDSCHRNTGGIIAYRDPDDLIEFLQLLRENGYRQ